MKLNVLLENMPTPVFRKYQDDPWKERRGKKNHNIMANFRLFQNWNSIYKYQDIQLLKKMYGKINSWLIGLQKIKTTKKLENNRILFVWVGNLLL